MTICHAKFTAGVSTSFTALLLAMGTPMIANMYNRIQKSNNDHFLACSAGVFWVGETLFAG